MNNVEKKKSKGRDNFYSHYQAISKIVSFNNIEFTEMSNFLADAIITSFCCNLLLAKKPGQKRYSKIKIF